MDQFPNPFGLLKHSFLTKACENQTKETLSPSDL